MTQLEIFQTIAAAVNSAAASKNPRLTLVAESDGRFMASAPMARARWLFSPAGRKPAGSSRAATAALIKTCSTP